MPEDKRSLADSEQLEDDDELRVLSKEQESPPARRGLAALFAGRDLDPAARLQVLEQLFFEGNELRPHLFRITALMALSTVIATLGLLADSAAVVIGAMLVAPLMTPILATAASTVMVWPRRQLRALMIVIASSAGAIALAALISWIVTVRDPLFSQEVLSRTQPTTLDLGVALAAGAAGAYVTVRTKAGGALPGVAIAVALVPPLSAVGILFEQGETALALSAFLLFFTNLVGIILMASVVFLLTGFIPHARTLTQSREIRVGLAISVILVAAVAYPLGLQGQSILADFNDERDLAAVVSDSLADEGSQAVLLNTEIDKEVDPPVVTLTLAAPAEEQLDESGATDAAAAIAEGFHADIELRLHYTDAVLGSGRVPAE